MTKFAMTKLAMTKRPMTKRPMTKLTAVLQHWPLPVMALLSSALIGTTAVEKVDLPQWLVDAFVAAPEPLEPQPEPQAPVAGFEVPYAPAPGRDDLTPVTYMSHVFELGDSTLPFKLSGIGPVFWDHAGRGTGTLIAPNVVLTTAHLFVDDGKWEGPDGATETPPDPSAGRIFLAACNRSYAFKAIHPGSLAPRRRLGLDYAIAQLTEPACAEAQVLPVAYTPDDIARNDDQIFLSTGYYAHEDVPRYVEHPLYGDPEPERLNPHLDLFGVRCQPVGREDTGDVSEGSTAVIATEGCDGRPGSSGSAVLLSRDGGETYAVVGVRNSSRPGTEYNNDTRIEGAFAAHLSRFIDLIRFLEANSATPHIDAFEPGGVWVPSDESTDEEGTP